MNNIARIRSLERDDEDIRFWKDAFLAALTGIAMNDSEQVLSLYDDAKNVADKSLECLRNKKIEITLERIEREKNIES